MTKILYSKTSPYVRKVLMLLWETGLNEKIELELAAPWTAETAVPKDNPLGKIPVLILDDGAQLYDSPVICEYLDTLHGKEKLFPQSGMARWTALRRQALGDGMMDAAAAAYVETVFHDEQKRSADWDKRQRSAIGRTLAVLETEADDLAGSFTIGHLAILSALGYLDLRFSDIGWRNGCPKLAAWFERESARRSFKETVPQLPK